MVVLVILSVLLTGCNSEKSAERLSGKTNDFIYMETLKLDHYGFDYYEIIKVKPETRFGLAEMTVLIDLGDYSMVVEMTRGIGSSYDLIELYKK